MKKQPNKWLVFSGLAFQIGVIMYLMIQLGVWIESKTLHGGKLPTILCALIGIIIIIYLIQKQSKNFDS